MLAIEFILTSLTWLLDGYFVALKNLRIFWDIAVISSETEKTYIWDYWSHFFRKQILETWNLSKSLHFLFVKHLSYGFRKRHSHIVARLLFSPSPSPKVTGRTCTESLICSFRPLFGNAWGLFPHCMCPFDDRSLLYGNVYPLMDHSIQRSLNLCLSPPLFVELIDIEVSKRYLRREIVSVICSISV